MFDYGRVTIEGVDSQDLQDETTDAREPKKKEKRRCRLQFQRRQKKVFVFLGRMRREENNSPVRQRRKSVCCGRLLRYLKANSSGLITAREGEREEMKTERIAEGKLRRRMRQGGAGEWGDGMQGDEWMK